MYGLVLMAAMAASPNATAADGAVPVVPVAAAPAVVVGGCDCDYGVPVVSGGCGGYWHTPAYLASAGCCGGYGSYSGYVTYSSCNGSCWGSSCYGSSCCGGGGGGLFGLRGKLFGGRSSGCCGGSCYGSSCWGSSCWGSSCYGSSCYGSSCHGWSTYIGSISGGCTGGAVYYGSSFTPASSLGGYGYGAGMPVSSAAPTIGRVPHVRIDGRETEYKAAQAKPNALPARLTVDLPASATLLVDGTATKGDGPTRNFHTPDLPVGQTFYYELTAELVVDGKTVSESKKVLVTAGDSLTESFPKLFAAVKASKDTVAQK